MIRNVLLIHAPVAKPSEPPAGVARLAGSLKRHGMSCRVLDASVEGILSLLGRPLPGSTDTWTSRAGRRLPAHLSDLRRKQGYEAEDRYGRAVRDVNRVLGQSVQPGTVRLSLANYSDDSLSPLRSRDLIRAAEEPQKNPFYSYYSERLRSLLIEEDSGVAGFSLNYLSQALCTFSMIGFLRKECPGIRVVLGGGLVTSWMSRPDWRNPFGGLVDEMVQGPGEKALLTCLGAIYREGADMPEYDSFDRGMYFAPGHILPYSASAGCYWHQCSFCPERAEGNPYRPVHPERVVEEVRGIAETMKPVLVHFLDNAMSPGLLEKIAGAGPGVPWYGFVRATHQLLDPDFCRALRRSGCVMLKIGLESGDQGVLDDLQKGIDVATASRALKTIKEAGIGTYVYLLFGTPAETAKEARETMEFTLRHGQHMDFLNLAVFNMPVRGPDADRYETKAFYEGDLSLYTGFVHPSGWDRSLVRSFLQKEFKRHPAIASILRRDPPVFTSNHAPFFVRPWTGVTMEPIQCLEE